MNSENRVVFVKLLLWRINTIVVGLLVFFTCHHCPLVIGDRLTGIQLATIGRRSLFLLMLSRSCRVVPSYCSPSSFLVCDSELVPGW